ncbi:hypothetical protein [Microlunatus aurantiacus]|uniref:hypothetical protein n=1 Tax=Microlunatus aurantiacus TaxID=446786 RepID=UPI0031CEA6FF
MSRTVDGCSARSSGAGAAGVASDEVLDVQQPGWSVHVVPGRLHLPALIVQARPRDVFTPRRKE